VIEPDFLPIAIRPLKRVLTERHGPEAVAPHLSGRVTAGARAPSGDARPPVGVFSLDVQRTPANSAVPGTGARDIYSSVRWSRQQLAELAQQSGRKTARVAVIGAGPSGLTVAHDMALLGHKVTLFEAGPKTGGTTRYGVPIYRVEQEAMDEENQSILDMGVEIRYNTPIGKALTLADLRRDWEVVFIGIGLTKGRALNIPGNDLAGVITAVDLLWNYNLGHPVTVGNRALVIAGGDVAYGPRLIVDAVRHGHIAALGMEEYIQGRPLKLSVTSEWTHLPNHVMFENWVRLARRPIPGLPLERRTGILPVELGYSEAEAAEQGSRCLECSVNTIFDGSKCILCNACVDICPWNCLKIVSLKQVQSDETFAKAVEAQLGAPLADFMQENELTVAAMLKDDDACTRCALCAKRCPTNAITMEAFRFKETLTYADR